MGLKKYFIKNQARESIEAEEIFLDAQAIRSLEDKGKLEQAIKSRNFFLFFSLIVVCLLGLFLRAGWLQIVKGEYYQDLARGNRLRIYSLPGLRGIIYDRSGEPLVRNLPVFDLTVNLADFFDSQEDLQESILSKLSQVLAKSNPAQFKFDLRQKIEQARGRVSQLVLAQEIGQPDVLILQGLVNQWPGWRLTERFEREYSPNLAHVLGYLGQVNPSDLINYPFYSLNDQIGKSGLELQYEDVLRGEPGQEQIEVDYIGKTQKLWADKPALSGQSLVLYLDKALQEKLYQTMDKFLTGQGAKKAAGLAIDPRSGGILALVSLPDFDNNLFAQGISQEDLSALENDSNEPFLNRVISGQYPSGSTIKPLIGAAALEQGIIKSREQINCEGGLSIVNKYNPEIVYYFPDWKEHGFTDMIKAIAQSCNVYFYTIAGGYGRIQGLGPEQIKKYLEYFGLGRPSNIDLPHEEIGLIPDKEWKAGHKPDEEWYLGDTYHLAIGQGDILVTPLQMASAISAIANRGILLQPKLVDRIIDSEQELESPRIEFKNHDSQRFVSQENIKVIQEGMRQAVISGSARALADLSVKAAGKTGTAQFGSQGQTHAWFVGYAPFQEPEIVLAILVEAGGQGHEISVPIAKEVLKWYFSK